MVASSIRRLASILAALAIFAAGARADLPSNGVIQKFYVPSTPTAFTWGVNAWTTMAVFRLNKLYAETTIECEVMVDTITPVAVGAPNRAVYLGLWMQYPDSAGQLQWVNMASQALAAATDASAFVPGLIVFGFRSPIFLPGTKNLPAGANDIHVRVASQGGIQAVFLRQNWAIVCEERNDPLLTKAAIVSAPQSAVPRFTDRFPAPFRPTRIDGDE